MAWVGDNDVEIIEILWAKGANKRAREFRRFLSVDLAVGLFWAC